MVKHKRIQQINDIKKKRKLIEIKIQKFKKKQKKLM